jgi:hypothetical protein
MIGREFRLSRDAREQHPLDDALFSIRGDLITGDLRAIRRFAADSRVDAGDLFALGLIHEIQHLAIQAYQQGSDPSPMPRALGRLGSGRPGRRATDRTLERYADAFPSTSVLHGRRTVGEELAGSTDGVSNRVLTLEELLLTALTNANPAAAPLRGLFDDRALAKASDYRAIVDRLRALLPPRPGFGEGGLDLLSFLDQPARQEPSSLAAQLRWMRDHWPDIVAPYLDQLLLALGVLAEEARARELAWAARGPFGGGGGAEVPDLAALDAETEQFSADRDWMPRLVLLAKSTYVWLDQLSRTYGREIRTLDAIPDEELAELARRGFTGLWLIGLWERSRASAEIKRRMGQPDAVASAYSLLDYRIADDLGGEAAYANLRDRAWHHGIRLASDMVPNHMGIDSTWVVEHPEWFLGLDHSPYPSYRFEGPDLSSDGRVEIKIEDGYWSHSDAAVVFQRRDRATGGVRYIYHGNDGTSMPWNDTAQLDYLEGEVREQVIQTIVAVARRFPIIRFDAAMTLARRHVERLWYPEPGQGGAIPSRSEHALSKADFLAAMPQEFWREVVDRVATEAPGTLLLAEAFWLMEGYFVRTLGMHRVYNSAFMHMLRDERNAEYRGLIAETLAYDPRILERYVDFMNNPDERTAVDQFGSGDKYAGVCTLLATLPGLPMFGHGQVEGFTEKYGMEFRRAQREETPDPGLRALHEWRIFPLLRRRALFAGAERFRLFDVHDEGGGLLEDVFAYCNRQGDERALVLYHNRYAEARGWAQRSVPFVEAGDPQRHPVRTETVAEALGLAAGPDVYYLVRDAVSHRQHLFRGAELAQRGLRVDLPAYGCQVLLDWLEVHDDDGLWERLHEHLGDSSVEDMMAARDDLRWGPVREAYRALVSADRARSLREALAPGGGRPALRALVESAATDLQRLVPMMGGEAGAEGDVAAARRRLDALAGRLERPAVAEAIRAELGSADAAWGGLLVLLMERALGRDDPSLADDPQGLDAIAAAVLGELGKVPEEAREAVAALRMPAAAGSPPDAWLGDPTARSLLRVHEWQGSQWLDREPYEALVRWWSIGQLLGGTEPRPSPVALRKRGAESGWRVDLLLGGPSGPRARKAAQTSPKGRRPKNRSR